MEADWEVEIGAEAPVIDAYWAGFIDLRLAPERAQQLHEATQLPALADTLARLNAPSSPVWTSKCDVWHPDTFDPDELDAHPSERSCAIACYVDLLHDPQDGIAQDEAIQDAIATCKSLCARLRQVPLRCCRADLIVRQASIVPGLLDLGVTAYFTACGATSEDAAATLSSALVAFVDSMNIGHPGPCVPKLQ